MNMDHLNFVVEARYYGYWIALVFAIICLLMFVYVKILDIKESKRKTVLKTSPDVTKKNLYRQILKQKMKRCLANAEMAKQTSKRYYFMLCLDDSRNGKCDRYVKMKDFWDKWEIKWLALADKFKE